MVMPIGASGSDVRTRSDKVAESLIREVLKRPELAFDMAQVQRSDQDDHPGSISRRIVQHLVEDDLVIADITGHNPNVFYELAVRHAARRPVITIAEEGTQLPFDIADQSVLFYDPMSWTSLDKARASLLERMNAAFQPSYSADNPIERYGRLRALEASQAPDDKGIALVSEQVETLTSLMRRLSRHVEHLRAADEYRSDDPPDRVADPSGFVDPPF